MASKKRPKADSKPKSLQEAGLQACVLKTIHRSQLIGADYNPRVLGEAEKRKLREGLKRHGMVSYITWNETTGHVVGGHQRLSQLDALMGTADYTLDVAAIAVSLEREKELNVLLNNPASQGDWDIDKLAALVKDSTLDISGMGFDHADVFRMFGESLLVERADALDELAEKVRKIRDAYEATNSGTAGKQNTDFYLVVVFRDAAQVNAFIEKHKLPDNRYQSGEELMRLIDGPKT